MLQWLRASEWFWGSISLLMGLIPWRLMKIKICIANNPIPEQTSETRNKQLEKSITFQTCDLIPCSLTPCRSHNHFYNWSHRFESNHWHYVIEFVNSAVNFPLPQKVFLTLPKVRSNTINQGNKVRKESVFFNCRSWVFIWCPACLRPCPRGCHHHCRSQTSRPARPGVSGRQCPGPAVAGSELWSWELKPWTGPAAGWHGPAAVLWHGLLWQQTNGEQSWG